MIKQFAIYSALVGTYDVIKQPLVVDERFDYILFSNDIKEDKIGVWQIFPITYSNLDKTRISRYVKTHPELLLSGYDASVWIDSNLQILTDYIYQRTLEFFESGVTIASMHHSARNCIYEEAFAVVNMMVEHEDVVVRWGHFLRKEKYPQNNGLCETGITYRIHNLESVRTINNLWWQCIEQFSRRDQLSFNYTLWKLNVPLTYIFGEGFNVRNTEHIQLVMHIDIKHNHCSISKNEAWLMRYCWKRQDKTKEIENLYYRLYAWPNSQLWIALAGQWYRVKYLIEKWLK